MILSDWTTIVQGTTGPHVEGCRRLTPDGWTALEVWRGLPGWCWHVLDWNGRVVERGAEPTPELARDAADEHAGSRGYVVPE